ncbi:phosphoethanolamine transferase [Arenicella xantha]|uniref:Glucan phosphoethanolaminetransferase (Alkaline phosphatase superfamily) n=1 Tax=Arenicella xantha TaxID=644221 RepID=A0A395JFC9_9GAMM|nr:phosphoethanolamine transferase [Arenicella xantha]RBP48492.1 glucan phosphoethanolaminetransferase (alkaline phosphatase superfamily) [Arenicella xantha]
MKKHRLNFTASLHLLVVVAAMAGLLYWFNGEVVSQIVGGKSIYQGAEIRFVNTRGVRISDYVLRQVDDSFLFAGGSPATSYIRLIFTDSGRYELAVRGQYPPWVCSKDELDKATIQIRGGTANATLALKSQEVKTINFNIAKGQLLTPVIMGNKVSQCARAEVTIYRLVDLPYYFIGFCVAWLLILVLTILTRSSPYIAVLGLGFNILLSTANATLSKLTPSSLAVDSGLAMCMVSLLFLIALLGSRSRIVAVALSLIGTSAYIAVSLIGAGLIAYFKVFDVAMSVEAIHGAMQSYDAQMVEFWKQYIGYRRTAVGLVVVFAVFLMMMHITSGERKRGGLLIMLLAFFLCGISILLGRIDHSPTYTLLEKSAIIYKSEIDAFKSIADNRTVSASLAQQNTAFAGNATVVVVGESVNKKHMSLYGYVQPTTPNLQQRFSNNELIVYKNAYSNHTHSNPTMALMLTQANQYNKRSWLESPSVFNYASAASVKTHWLTNHRLLGGWSNKITTIAREADRLDTINYKIGYGLDSARFDEDLLPLFDKTVTERPDQLTFLHLYSNHSLYCRRYPTDFRGFNSSLPVSHFSQILKVKKAAASTINCYDTSIRYTDLVLEKIIARLEKNDQPSVMLYVADHSEEVIGDRTHNSALFTYDMINIPLIVWANEAWKTKHADLWLAIQNNKDQIWTNDLLFSSVLGLSGIESTAVDPTKSLTSSAYQIPGSPLTLHGRVNVDSPQNWNYWQINNAALAQQQGQQLYATGIRSVGEAMAALNLGLTNLVLDVEVSSEGELIVESLQGDSMLTVKQLLSELAASPVQPKSIALNVTATKGAAKVEQQIQALSEAFSIPMLSVDQSVVMAKPVDLWSPSFARKLSDKNLSGEGHERFTVNIKTRYTHPAPIPAASGKSGES